MGLFKSKEEKLAERKALVKQSMKELEKRIRKLKEQEAVYIKAAKVAQQENLPEQIALAKNALKANVDTTASGLQYTIIAAGADEKIQPQDTVWVNYKGSLIDGTVFDQNENTEFVANRVIRGWTEGLGLLGEGGKAVFYIPADLAYGDRGNQAIQPNSVLVFDVEVLKVGRYVPAEK